MKTLTYRQIAYRRARGSRADGLPLWLAALGAVCAVVGWMVQSGSFEVASR